MTVVRVRNSWSLERLERLEYCLRNARHVSPFRKHTQMHLHTTHTIESTIEKGVN